MDTTNFLSRVIPPGNYVCIAFSDGPGLEVNHNRFFPRDEIYRAANFAKFMNDHGKDVYHSQASFVDVVVKGQDKSKRDKLYGERKAHNAQAIKSFWIDLDIKREGDKKTTANSFPDRAAALRWANDFIQNLGIPKWSLAVSSGFGIHLYWVLEDAMTVPDWLPFGKAWSAAMVAHGFTGDAGLSGNPVCLLRPPGTSNYKTGSPVPAFVYTESVRGDVPNDLILEKLKTHLPSYAVVQPGQTQSTVAAALAQPGSNVMSFFQGAPNMSAAAQTALPAPMRATLQFAALAQPGGCEQVIHSLQNHGALDTRQLWYLGFLSAAVFCDDGKDFIHIIGDGHPKYTPADTEKEFDRARNEQATKGTGWPTCQHFATHRPSVCQTCPHFNPADTKQSPLHFAKPINDFPDGYRRDDNTIKRFVSQGKTGFWETILAGDVFDAVLDEIPRKGFQISFKHRLKSKVYEISAMMDELSNDPSSIFKLFQRQGLIVTSGKEAEWRNFLIAYMQLLRNQQRERTAKIDPFGWLEENGEITGFALAGTAYRPDGREEPAPGGDPIILANHEPLGVLDPWREAANFVVSGRPDLQVMVAASFAAPLVRIAGHNGLIMSAWSRESGVGKTSALLVAQTVWGAPGMSMSLNDTHNSVAHKLASTRVLPAFWDEMQVGDSKQQDFIQFVFRVAQGKERARMGSDLRMREVGEWETLLVACANAPLMDKVLSVTQHTEAGALRVFEYKITHPSMPQDPNAARRIAQAKVNYGHAGKTYAKYLAINHAGISKVLDIQLTKIISDTNAQQSERMLSAFMACTLVGARIATKLGLVDFDISAIEKFLYNAFYEMRGVRSNNTLVSSYGFEIEEILSRFMALHMGRKLVTTRFANKSEKLDVSEIKWYPQDARHVDIHVSQQDAMLRIDRTLFVDYCNEIGLSPTEIIKELCSKFLATDARSVIAGGTGYASGRRQSISIPLNGPNAPVDWQGFMLTPPGDDGRRPSRDEQMKENK